MTLPTPKNFLIGRAARKSKDLSGGIVVSPFGLLKSEATLARNLLKETPAEAVSCKPEGKFLAYSVLVC